MSNRRHPFPITRYAFAVAALAIVSGCTRERADPVGAPRDPAVEAAFAAPLMIDPDLARINPRSAALSFGGPASAPVPTLDQGLAETAGATAEAARLAGGVLASPPPPESAPAPPGGTLSRALATVTGIAGARADCAAVPQDGFIWAARMPADLPVFPRAHTQLASGADAPGCRLRAMTALTPVAGETVVRFYWTLARRNGYAPRHAVRGPVQVVYGRKGKAAFVVWVRSRDGVTAFDLATTTG